MKKFVITWTLVTISLSACNNLELVDKKMTLKLDPALSDADKALLRSDIRAMEGYQIHADKDGYFAKSFGTSDETGVLKYMDERVNYIVPEQQDLSSRISIGWLPLPSSGSSGSDSGNRGGSDDRAVVMALNIGTALWFANLNNPLPFNLRFKIGSSRIPLTSPRVGIVELGVGYTMTQTPRGTQIGAPIRVSTLVHEARHSDCTGGLSAADIAGMRKGQMPQNHECGHLHIPCPPGHPLEGLLACDDLAWGAYSMGAIYSAAIVQNCENCSEQDKQQSLMNALDSFSRVTVLDAMMEGKLGDPDMSSSSEIRKKDPAVKAMISAIAHERRVGNSEPAMIDAE